MSWKWNPYLNTWINDDCNVEVITTNKCIISTQAFELPKSERHTNCPNCGAPLHSDTCEYCGSEY